MVDSDDEEGFMAHSDLEQVQQELDSIARCLSRLDLAIKRIKLLCSSAARPDIENAHEENLEDRAPVVYMASAFKLADALESHLRVQIAYEAFEGTFQANAVGLSDAIAHLLVHSDLERLQTGDKDIDQNFDELTRDMDL
jgi:hypothetical protein